MMLPKRHSSSELIDALEHIIYEMWKYRQSVAYYEKIQLAGGDAALEFRVLHHRVLLEFFYGPPKHRDNIVASEYIDDWNVLHDRAALPWLNDYVTRCHTMLAHISVERSRLKRAGLKSWGSSWMIVEPHLDRTIEEFVVGLKKEHRRIALDLVNDWRHASWNGGEVLDALLPALNHD
jgi:hypothetical protein